VPAIAERAQRSSNVSDNPLEMNPERKRRIEERAYHLWEEAGRPHGRDLEFWEQARELIGMEESGPAGTVPVETVVPNQRKGRIEEAELQENLGEFPGRTDQGDRPQTPRRRSKR
jgi:hypothetical protein